MINSKCYLWKKRSILRINAKKMFLKDTEEIIDNDLNKTYVTGSARPS